MFIIEVMANAGSVVYSQNAYYHYDQREGSAVRSRFREKKLSGLDAYEKILALFREKQYTRAYIYGCAALMNLGIQLGCHVLESGEAYSEYLTRIRTSIDSVRKTVVSAKCVDRETKLKAILSGVSLAGTCRLLLLRGKLKWKKSAS